MNYYEKYLKYKFKYLQLSNYQSGGITWMENNRGNSNDGKYPPCYNICGATKAIYDILEKNKLIQKYSLLLNLYSIILCQEVYLKNKKCSETMIDERVAQIENILGNKPIEEKHLKIIKNNINREPTKIMRKLMEITTVLIEEQIDNINKENINKEDLDKLNRMNTVFYNVHYPVISENC